MADTFIEFILSSKYDNARTRRWFRGSADPHVGEHPGDEPRQVGDVVTAGVVGVGAAEAHLVGEQLVEAGQVRVAQHIDQPSRCCHASIIEAYCGGVH